MNINSWLQSFWPRVRQSIPVPPSGFFPHLLYEQPAYTNRKKRKTHTDSTLVVFFFFFCIFFNQTAVEFVFFLLSSHFLFLLFKRACVKLPIHIEKWKLRAKTTPGGGSDWTVKAQSNSESSHLRSVTCLWSARTRCRLTRRCFMGWGETLNSSVSAPLPPSFLWLTGSIMRRKVRWILVKCQGPSGRHCKNALLVSCSECRVVLSLIQCVCPPSPQGDVDRR